MIDHLTAAILAAARLDEPHAIAHVTEGRPSLRASMERGGYLHPDHDDAEKAVGPFPSPEVTSHPATLGAWLASPPFAFDYEVPPHPYTTLPTDGLTCGEWLAAMRAANPDADSFAVPECFIVRDPPAPLPYATRAEFDAAADVIAAVLTGNPTPDDGRMTP